MAVASLFMREALLTLGLLGVTPAFGRGLDQAGVMVVAEGDRRREQGCPQEKREEDVDRLAKESRAQPRTFSGSASAAWGSGSDTPGREGAYAQRNVRS
jgi:hypothetical protein